MSRALVCLAVAVLVSSSGCGGEPPAKAPQKTDDGVPANSTAESRLKGDEKPAPDASSAPKEDPTQPYMTKVGDAPSGSSGSSGSGGSSGGSSEPASGKPTGKGSTGGGGTSEISREECEKLFDKYLDLEITKNPKLAGVGPEVIAQAKQMARQQGGEMPCDATRAQYTCGMAATSTAGWQRCMKKK